MVENSAALALQIDAAAQQIDAAVPVVIAPHHRATGQRVVQRFGGGKFPLFVFVDDGQVVGALQNARTPGIGHAVAHQIGIAVVVVIDPGQIAGDEIVGGTGELGIHIDPGQQTGGFVLKDYELYFPVVIAPRYRQIEIAVVVVVGPGQRAAFQLEGHSGQRIDKLDGGIPIQSADRIVQIKLGHGVEPPRRGDIVAGDGQIGIAVVVVVGPGQIAVVKIQHGFAVGLVQHEFAVVVAVELSQGNAHSAHAGNDQVGIAVAVVVGPGQAGVAHSLQT